LQNEKSNLKIGKPNLVNNMYLSQIAKTHL